MIRAGECSGFDGRMGLATVIKAHVLDCPVSRNQQWKHVKTIDAVIFEQLRIRSRRALHQTEGLWRIPRMARDPSDGAAV